MVDISLSNATVFPEDFGTGTPTTEGKGDHVSAGHLGTLTLNRAANSFVESGADFTFNTDNTLLTVSKTLAFIRFEGDIQVQNRQGEYEQPWNYPMMFMATFPTEDSLPVTGGGVNDVYLWINRSEEDGAYIRIGQNVATPDGPSVQLGSVDPRDGTAVKTNRGETGGITDADILEAVNTDADHGTTAPHDYTTSADLQQGGSDQLNVTGLAGDLADPQDPTAHDHSGENIQPASVAGAAVAYPSDDLQSKIDALGTDDELVVQGDHVISAALDLKDDMTFTINGSIKIEDGVIDDIINSWNRRNVLIRGKGELVGNKTTIPNDDTDGAGGIALLSDSKSCTIEDIEIRDTRNVAIKTPNVTDMQIRNVYIHDIGTSVDHSDGIYIDGTDILVNNCRIKNVTDTHCAVGNSDRFALTGNVFYNTDTWNNTTAQDAYQCVAVGTQNDNCRGSITGNSFMNPGSSALGILQRSSTTNLRHITISSNYMGGAAQRGIWMSGGDQCPIIGNYIDASGVGINAIYSQNCPTVGNTILNGGNTAILGQNPDIIAMNEIDSPSNHGIVTNGGIVLGNNIMTPGSDGIRVFASNTVVGGNTIDGASGVGINMQPDVTDAIVGLNRCRNCINGIAHATGSDFNIFIGNNIRGNTNAGFSGTAGTNTVKSANLT